MEDTQKAVYSGDKEKPKEGIILKGQGWVELHGNFTLSELEALITKIKKNYQVISNVDTK